MFRRLKPSPNSLHLEMYSEWRSNNYVFYGEFLTLLGLFISVFMIPADHLFLTNPADLSEIRGLGILLLITNLGYIQFSSQTKTNHLGQSFLGRLSLLTPVVLILCQYLYFNFYYPLENPSAYLTGLLLVNIFGAFLLCRFREEHLMFHGFIYFFGLISLAMKPPFEVQSLYILMISNTVSLITGTFFRWDFRSNLLNYFHLISAFVPKRIAKHIAASGDYETMNFIFRPRDRYTVCLCSDWRGYQRLTKSLPPDLLSRLVEDYYNRIFESLDRIDPSGDYFVNWTADELFIIFYDKNDNAETVDQRALTFAFELSGRIFTELRRDFDIDVRYDIGLASGIGFLGLQGPAQLKKTTITGESAGFAKRLETEAKEHRVRRPQNISPILIMDEALHRRVELMKLIPQEIVEQQMAVTKDIEGKSIFIFQTQQTGSTTNSQIKVV